MGNNMLLVNALVYRGGCFEMLDVRIVEGVVTEMAQGLVCDGDEEFDCGGKVLMPGLVDVHVHFREPGFEYKETIESGARAAARGGYTTVCTMPNVNPAPDCVENIGVQLEAARRCSPVNIYPYASITKGQKGSGELVDFEALAPLTFGFSDDGRGVQSDDLMLEAMKRAKAVDRHIVAHCEDESLLKKGGCIHDGEYAAEHGLVGICSESEWGQVARDIELVRQTGCKYHICHISTKETVELVRRAKAEGLPVTCETAPHYLLLNDSNLQEEGRYKMNPPLRSAEDQAVLVAGIVDGTIDMIATDHAPHSAEEKGKGLKDSMFGIVGLEVAFPLLYTYLVKKGVITLERLVELMSINPRKIFGFEGGLNVGDKAEVAVMDLEVEYAIDTKEFVSKGKATPFEGWEVCAMCEMVIVNKQVISNCSAPLKTK